MKKQLLFLLILFLGFGSLQAMRQPINLTKEDHEGVKLLEQLWKDTKKLPPYKRSEIKFTVKLGQQLGQQRQQILAWNYNQQGCAQQGQTQQLQAAQQLQSSRPNKRKAAALADDYIFACGITLKK